MSIHRWVLGMMVVLGGCRASIAPVEVGPLHSVETTPPAGLTACWVESGRFGSFTASSLVVRHPEGTVAIDAGNSTNLKEEIQVYEGRTYRWLRALPARLRPRESLADRFGEAGVDPGALRWVLPTHAHLDHLGGVLDLPPTPVLLSEPEQALVAEAREHVITEVMPAHAHGVEGHEEALRFDGGPYEIFDRHADLFGDGSVVVVPMPGHTPGSVAVFVNLPDGTRLLHVGDAVNDRSQIERLRGRASIMRRTDMDEPQANDNVARLHELQRRIPELRIIPAHERRAWAETFGRPGQGCAG
ncbi:MAG: MBL fold metallo-hydrolase [Myxococcales bacterium]|nr:MBL fold metallo-hydrolase [Myxococcales bacterium]MCB9717814.1 MBL fold metallo-hydrolase [Myxococcales bacterium]